MIREMTKSDWQRVSEIYLQGIENGIATFETELPSYEKFDIGHTKECRYVYIKDGQIAGYTVFSPVNSRYAYRGVVELSIYVGNEFKGIGIGQSLMENAIMMAEKHGFWTIYSSAFSCNTASVNLHKKCGFRVIGYREKIAKDKFGNWQDTTIFEYRNAIE